MNVICPKCKIEYQQGYTTCADCGTDLVEKEERREDEGSLLRGFGKISAQKAISALFYVGLLPVLITSIIAGRLVYMNSTYMKGVSYLQDGQKWYTEKAVNNGPLGFLTGVALFIIQVLVWKITCELLIIIFRCFETYVRKNK